ncbi:MAG: hypothetical protein OXU77_06980 [Gammaproteobacteria bacterium]|nr:hypothetical protein [Gammaproteobacteria bacterium]MDE0443823.1 hypothetical protein [Gammaproteobacteria bacterium]
MSGPKIEVPVSTGLLDALANELRERHASLHPVIDRAGHALAEAMKRHDPEETADPQGEGAGALEQAESYFKDSRAELQRLRKACVELGASPSHRVFTALRNLDELYVSIIAIMQEVRWSVLIFDGVRDRADSPAGRTFATSSEWIASLHGDE